LSLIIGAHRPEGGLKDADPARVAFGSSFYNASMVRPLPRRLLMPHAAQQRQTTRDRIPRAA